VLRRIGDGANRVFVLVGPPAEEPRVSNDRLPIPSDLTGSHSSLMRTALYGRRLSTLAIARAKRSREPHSARANAKSAHSSTDSSIAVADRGAGGIRSTLVGCGPQSTERDE
jgi:hypothetical protein